MLHDLDPMGTCCRLILNIEDEYRLEAPHIARLLTTGVPLHDAVCQVFDECFWEDCLKNRLGYEGLRALIASLARGLKRLSSAQDDMLTRHAMLFQYILPDLAAEDLGWSYARFMQIAPEPLNPDAAFDGPTGRAGLLTIDVDALPDDPSDDTSDTSDAIQSEAAPEPYIPSPDEPDAAGDMHWLHALLFEKTRRRTPPEQLLSYPQFLQQVRARHGAGA
jgi:hypothetical protein